MSIVIWKDQVNLAGTNTKFRNVFAGIGTRELSNAGCFHVSCSIILAIVVVR